MAGLPADLHAVPEARLLVATLVCDVTSVPAAVYLLSAAGTGILHLPGGRQDRSS